MKTALLEYCTCPHCEGVSPFTLGHETYKNGEVFSGILICKNQHRFKIDQYIPDFIDPDDRVARDSEVYDILWDDHPQECYEDRVKEYSSKFQNFARLPGHLQPYFQDKVVLDVGCGNGRFSYLASTLGATHVVGVDYSVEALRRTLLSTGNPHNCSFIRANIQCLPLLPRFDFVFSMGVLHHTPSTRQSYQRIVCLLKPGGIISVYLYGKYTLPIITWPLRVITRRLDRTVVRKACQKLGMSYDPGIDSIIPLKDIFKRLGKLDILGISRLTFEGLTTPYLWEHSLKELVSWFEESGVDLISTTAVISASGRLRKPRE